MLQQRVFTLFSSLIFVTALGFGTLPSASADCGKEHKHEHKHDHKHGECNEASEDEACPRCGKDKAEKSCGHKKEGKGYKKGHRGHKKGMKEKAYEAEESSPAGSRSPRVFEL